MAVSRNTDAAGEIEILLAANTPAKIPYSDTPLSQPGAKIIHLTHDEYLRKFSCQYSESIHGNQKTLRECHALLFENWQCRMSPKSEAEIRERLGQPLDCLVICKIDDLRYGLFTSRTIRAGTLVAFYAGEIKPMSEINKFQDNHLYDLTTPVMQECIYAATPDKIGGVGRFMQHLPEKSTSNGDEDELADVIFTNPATKIAHENIDTRLVDYNGIPLILMYAEEDIEADRQLGYSFGQKFWRIRNERPRYFTPSAELIPLSDYHYKNDRGGITLYLLDRVKNNPLLVYEEAVNLYGRKKYQYALAAFRLSVELFTKKNPAGSIEAAKSLSGMASCYRKLNNILKAIEACELAIQIYANNKSQDTEKIYAKYEECLKISNKSLQELSDYGLTRFKEKNYVVAVRIHEYLLKRYKQAQGDLRLDIAMCHSALSSCYVGLNDLEKAIHHCRTALQIRQSIPDLRLQSKIIDENEYKLAALENLLVARKRAANSRH